MLEELKEDVKIIVAGHVGSGKTTYIKSLSAIDVITTEKKSKHSNEHEIKSKQKRASNITTAFDFGIAYGDNNRKIRVFGIPGHKRFSFMWEILARGTNGYIFILDSTNQPLWNDTIEQIEMFMKKNSAPFIIIANKQDLKGSASVKKVRNTLEIPEEIDVLPGIAINKKNVLQNFSVLIDNIIAISH